MLVTRWNSPSRTKASWDQKWRALSPCFPIGSIPTVSRVSWHVGDSLEFTIADSGPLGSKMGVSVTLLGEVFYPYGFEGELPINGLEHATLHVCIVPMTLAQSIASNAELADTRRRAEEFHSECVEIVSERDSAEDLNKSERDSSRAELDETRKGLLEAQANFEEAILARENSNEFALEMQRARDVCQAKLSSVEQVMAHPLKLQVSILRAFGLKHLHLTGVKVWCVCEVKHRVDKSKPAKMQTKALANTLFPEWNETTELGPWHVGDPVEFVVQDQDTSGSEGRGSVMLPGDKFYPYGFAGELALNGLEEAKLRVRVVPMTLGQSLAPNAELEDTRRRADELQFECNQIVAQRDRALTELDETGPRGVRTELNEIRRKLADVQAKNEEVSWARDRAKESAEEMEQAKEACQARLASVEQVAAHPLKLQVLIRRAVGLEHLSLTGGSLWCSCQVKHRVDKSKPAKMQTKAIANTTDPEWNETCELDPWYVGDPLEFVIVDQGKSGSTVEESVVLSGDRFYPSGFEGELAMHDSGHAKLHVHVVPMTFGQSLAPNAELSGTRRRAEEFRLECKEIMSERDIARVELEQVNRDNARSELSEVRRSLIAPQAEREEISRDKDMTKTVAEKIKLTSEASQERLISVEQVAEYPLKLHVSIVRAVGLKRLNFTGDKVWCSCYVRSGEQDISAKLQTNAIVNTFDPEWNETSEMEPWSVGDPLEFVIEDQGSLGSKAEGSVMLPSDKFYPKGFDGELTINGLEHATLCVRVVPMILGHSLVSNAELSDTRKRAEEFQRECMQVISEREVVRDQLSEAKVRLDEALLHSAKSSEAQDFARQAAREVEMARAACQESLASAEQEVAAHPLRLQVSVIKAVGLKHLNFSGDKLLCVCQVRHADKDTKPSKMQTKALVGTLNPEWNETRELKPWHMGDPVDFMVEDHGMLGIKMEGSATLSADRFYPYGFEGELPINGLKHAMLHVAVVPMTLGQSHISNAELVFTRKRLEEAQSECIRIVSERDSAMAKLEEGKVKLEEAQAQWAELSQSEARTKETEKVSEEGRIAVDERLVATTPLKLQVSIMRAAGLQHLDFTGDKMSCVCQQKGSDGRAKFVEMQTRDVDNTLNPEWNETSELASWQIGDALEFIIKDNSKLGSEVAGSVTVPSDRFYPNGFEGELVVSGVDGAVLHVRIMPLTSDAESCPLVARLSSEVAQERAEVERLRKENAQLDCDVDALARMLAELKNAVNVYALPEEGE
eukprot:TRINITY_DN8839_c0_g1_i3.p1 TRINITY_DN8839_c0_g1~~TRINITY_DN8839_c0_g1_i3.p1  ORF type:complete len:1250 (+),score=240.71 TRINITY_DN8839_c0_g1_i3:677-4426(+)